MCRFFGVQLCIIKTACLGKICRVKCKNALSQSDCRIFKLEYLKNYWRYKVYFLHVGTYLLKLQIDDVILDGHVQACLAIPKGAIKMLRSQKLNDI